MEVSCESWVAVTVRFRWESGRFFLVDSGGVLADGVIRFSLGALPAFELLLVLRGSLGMG